jgi:CBS domain-containing protein
MRARIGDEIVVESQVVGRPPRRGRVQEILGDADTEHFRVRWEDGHESVYFPGADGHVVQPVAAVPTQSSGPGGARGDVVVRQASVADVVGSADRLDGHATLRAAADLLARRVSGGVVVQEPGSAPALLTAQEVLAAIAAGADPDQVWAADVASDRTLWLASDERLDRAAEEMREGRVGHALVRDRDGLVGVCALVDVLAGLADGRMPVQPGT